MGDTAEMARGRWLGILPALGVSKKFLKSQNGPCPACGGKDRFSFTNRNKDGDYICRQCGAGKGIGLVAKVRGWSFKQAADAVDNIIGNKPVPDEPMDQAHEAARAFFDSCPEPRGIKPPPLSTQQATLWLRRYQPLKLPEWLMQHADPDLEMWINLERPFGYYPDDRKRYECAGSLVNIKLKNPEAVQ